MIRISSDIPALRRGRTSPIIHNVLDSHFEAIIKDISFADTGRFVSIGSAHSYRGLPSLICGYAEYRRTGGRTNLLVVASPGSREEEVAIRHAATDLPGLTVTDGVSRKEAVGLMAGSKGAIFPSFVEASPISLLEAQAVGAPVAFSNLRAHLDLVGDGYPGFSFEAGEASQTARALHQLDDAPKVQDGPLSSGERRAASRETWSCSVEGFLRSAL
jgi:glycosyltransferase involved in cell wall biosynthesis